MLPLANSALSRAQREAVIPPRKRPKTKQASIVFQSGQAPAATLSDLDGPLSRLLAQRGESARALAKAELACEQFLAAAQWLIDKAAGKPIPDEYALPAEVLHWVRAIQSQKRVR
jgi:hypothetical protein